MTSLEKEMLRQTDAAAGFAPCSCILLVIYLLVLTAPNGSAQSPLGRFLFSNFAVCFVPLRVTRSYCHPLHCILVSLLHLKASINLKFAGAQILN